MTRRAFRLISALALVALGLACGAAGPTVPGPVTGSFDFKNGPQGWSAGIAGYPLSAPSVEFVSEYRPLLPPLDTTRSAWFASSNDHDWDLFMYYKRRADGLLPNGKYSVSFSLDIATDSPSACGGLEGTGYEGVFVKAGATFGEPTTITSGGYVRSTLAKGDGASSGTETAVLGNIANGEPCADSSGKGTRVWRAKSFSGGLVPVTADPSGAVWLVFGTDSTSEKLTRLYYTKFSATFTPR